MMRRTETVIIGGGQAGLALSRSLNDRDVPHVVLERGRIGERWRSERWDSLRLLTPRWLSRLPGQRYEGPDPDGFMTKDELVAYLEAYAASFDAPVHCGVTVEAVRQVGGGFEVRTDQGRWLARNVVVATGDCQRAFVPPFAQGLPDSIVQMVPTRYRNPEQLPAGGVLVVGASATGLQLAAEIQRSGRTVTLSVGRHTRMPRTYRGRDLIAWLDEMGILDERAEDVRDLAASRAQPSLQLVGTPQRETLDLAVARSMGIRLTGRARAVDGSAVHFDDNLVEDVAAADLKLAGLLVRIDEHIEATGVGRWVGSTDRPDRVDVDDGPRSLDLEAEGIHSVLWATGFRRSYPWLHVPVVTADGEIIHDGGVTPVPGLYVMGLRFLRRRSSSFIDGQARDAEEIAEHLMQHGTAAAAVA
jgi:putative flavoprotein involved in K+ transport